uniref:Uncharacterized protein n=1 Tax=Siphoviridae sp. ctvFN21 TaxID=2826511 RepID=A0A8S5R0P6_9CAUD|nr:MAG TPA: hypothetical protein [Siphoviridae sp. ctvFN21]
MSCVKNTMKVIKSVRGSINPYYDMSHTNINEIYTNNTNLFDMLCDAFNFGYAQGRKATLSEIRKAAK